MKQSCEKTSTKNSPVSRRQRREELSVIAFVCLISFMLFGCFGPSYEYSVTCRDCDANNCRIQTGEFAVCRDDRAFSYSSPKSSVHSFLKAPLDEIQLEWALWIGTDVEKAPAIFGYPCIEAKKSFPEQNAYYCTKKVRISVPDFIKSEDLDKIQFDFYHDKVIAIYKTKNEVPEKERPEGVESRTGSYYLEDGTPYDEIASNFPEYFKKNPAAREEDYMKEQRRLYDAFREKFPGKSDSDFLMFLRYVQRTPMVNAENDPMMPMIERNVKHVSYVIPDWMKPYENTPQEEIFGAE